MKKRLNIFTIILLIFNGISGLGGGIVLILAPDGSLIQMPLDMLKYSPFNDYLIPGIILLLANGILSFVVAISIIKKIKNFPLFIIFQGCVSLFWIVIQMLLIRSVHSLHVIYGCIGIIFTVIGIILQKTSK